MANKIVLCARTNQSFDGETVMAGTPVEVVDPRAIGGIGTSMQARRYFWVALFTKHAVPDEVRWSDGTHWHKARSIDDAVARVQEFEATHKQPILEEPGPDESEVRYPERSVEDAIADAERTRQESARAKVALDAAQARERMANAEARRLADQAALEEDERLVEQEAQQAADEAQQGAEAAQQQAAEVKARRGRRKKAEAPAEGE